MCRQEWALGTSRIGETQESQGERGTFWGRVDEWSRMLWAASLLPSPPGRAVPTWHRAVWEQVTSVKRKEMAAKANDHPYL